MARTIGQKQSGFQKLVITKSEFRKSRIHSHELFFNGELYDIKSELFSANKVVLLVIRDKNEKNILDKIRDLTHNTKSRHNELPGQLVTLLIHSFICPVTENKFILNEAEHSSYYPFSESLISFLVEIASPPPEKV